jgi:hypothetical protein
LEGIFTSFDIVSKGTISAEQYKQGMFALGFSFSFLVPNQRSVCSHDRHWSGRVCRHASRSIGRPAHVQTAWVQVFPLIFVFTASPLTHVVAHREKALKKRLSAVAGR